VRRYWHAKADGGGGDSGGANPLAPDCRRRRSHTARLRPAAQQQSDRWGADSRVRRPTLRPNRSKDCVCCTPDRRSCARCGL